MYSLFDKNWPIIFIMDNLFPCGKAEFSDFVMNTISPLFTIHLIFQNQIPIIY